MYSEYKKTLSGEIHGNTERTGTLAESTWQNQASTSQNDCRPLEETDQDEQLLDEIKKAVEVCRGNDLPNPTERQDTAITDQKVSVLEAGTSGKEIQAEMQYVPETMLRHAPYMKKKYFVPKELSIGPIYGADEHLFKKKLKLQLAARFISESGNEVDSLFKKIQTELKKGIEAYFNIELKKDREAYFNKNVTSFPIEKLLRLVFLDGCTILGFIHIYVNKELKLLHISDGQAALIQQDMFLLENQIPFTVLDLMMTSGGDENKNRKMKFAFFQFVCHMSNITFPRDPIEMRFLHFHFVRHISSKMEDSVKPVHILDVLREVILFDRHHHFGSIFTVLPDIFLIACCCVPILLFGCVRYFRRSHGRLPKYYRQIFRKQTFRNVQELKTAGIRFMPCDSLSAVSFDSLFSITAQLRLPRLVVDGSTDRKLLNLVAHEICLPKLHPNRQPWVTSYVKLLDLFIDNEQDVKDLRAANIVQNRLCSDVKAAKMVNKMGSFCSEPLKDTYEEVEEKIEKHYESKFARWTTEICNSHFSSPLTILALFAATTVLVLTAIQTWYAVYPKK